MKNNRVFYSYTPQDYKVIHVVNSRKEGVETKQVKFGDRATICASMVGSHLKYGVSICNENDSFDKTLGRTLAYERMMGGFGFIEVSKIQHVFPNLSMDELALKLLNSLTKSVYFSLGKYNKRIQEYNRTNNKIKNKQGVLV